MIAHSYSKGNGSNTSSGEVNTTPKFRTLEKKSSQAVVDPLVVLNPLIVQDPLLVPNPSLALAIPDKV